jgi:formylglycine-generating enzyme required for sulfatase activity
MPSDDSIEGRVAAYLVQTSDVDASPASCIFEGVFEMFGNVEEWTESPGVDEDAQGNLQASLTYRIVAGFAWFASAGGADVNVFATMIADAGPLHPYFWRGFRCASSIQP